MSVRRLRSPTVMITEGFFRGSSRRRRSAYLNSDSLTMNNFLSRSAGPGHPQVEVRPCWAYGVERYLPLNQQIGTNGSSQIACIVSYRQTPVAY